VIAYRRTNHRAHKHQLDSTRLFHICIHKASRRRTQRRDNNQPDSATRRPVKVCRDCAVQLDLTTVLPSVVLGLQALLDIEQRRAHKSDVLATATDALSEHPLTTSSLRSRRASMRRRRADVAFAVEPAPAAQPVRGTGHDDGDDRHFRPCSPI